VQPALEPRVLSSPHHSQQAPHARPCAPHVCSERQLSLRLDGKCLKKHDRHLLIVVACSLKVIDTKMADVADFVSTKSVDVCFTFDTTGSMSSQINATKQRIVAFIESLTKMCNGPRFALIPYKDYSDGKAVVVTHDFSTDIAGIKQKVDQMNASGGGDTPEAVGYAMQATLQELSWRPDVIKVCVIIADAPPHGLGCPCCTGDSLPKGEPEGRDPLSIAYAMGRAGIRIYSIGCNLSCEMCISFYSGISDITGGIFVPLKDAQQLIPIIQSGIREDLSLLDLIPRVVTMRDAALAADGKRSLVDISAEIAKQLQSEGVTVHSVAASTAIRASQFDGVVALSGCLADLAAEFKFLQQHSSSASRPVVAAPQQSAAPSSSLIQTRHVLRILQPLKQQRRIRADQLDPAANRMPVTPQVKLIRSLRLGLGARVGVTEAQARASFIALVKELLARNVDVVQILQVIGTGPAPPKPEATLLALALCACSKVAAQQLKVGDALNAIARTPTQMFQYIACCKEVGVGWGRHQRSVVASWYKTKKPLALAQAATKMWNRNGYTHYDVLRLAHPRLEQRPPKVDGSAPLSTESSEDPSLEASSPALPEELQAMKLIFSYIKKRGLSKFEEGFLPTELVQAQVLQVEPAQQSVEDIGHDFELVSLNDEDDSESFVMPSSAVASAASSRPRPNAHATCANFLAAVELIRGLLPVSTPQPAKGTASGSAKSGAKSQSKQSQSSSQAPARKQSSAADDLALACALIRKYRLSREHVPTLMLDSREVWMALMQNMGATAMLRNLNKLTSLGLLGVEARGCPLLRKKLLDLPGLEQARVGPLDILVSADVYSQGTGELGKLTWTPQPWVISALDECFSAYTLHLSQSATPSKYRVLLGIDLRASMLVKVGSTTGRKAAAATALVWKRLNPHWRFVGFGENGCIPIEIDASTTLVECLRLFESITPGPADIGSLIADAADRLEVYDAIVAFTSQGSFRSSEPLEDQMSLYRQIVKCNDSALFSVTMSATPSCTIETDADSGLHDCVFSSSLLEELLGTLDMREFCLL
jgi:Mg-chelatase subunit ChlD